MQPLNTMVSPRSGSTMGWAPRSERSMISRRLKVSAIGPLAHTPLPSGPRSFMVAPIRATVPTSARSPTRNSPANPHTLVHPPGHAARLYGPPDEAYLGLRFFMPGPGHSRAPTSFDRVMNPPEPRYP